jgi:hypothetical protein
VNINHDKSARNLARPNFGNNYTITLETAAAAVIGILAVAGKVAEILGPVVSAFRDVTKHTTAGSQQLAQNPFGFAKISQWARNQFNSVRRFDTG